MAHAAYRFYYNQQLLKCDSGLKIHVNVKSPCHSGDFLEDIEIGLFPNSVSGAERP
jgi:hypothetical protein